MSVEDAGSIEAELRLKLDQMQKDALEAQRKMDALAVKLKAQGQTAGKGFAGGMKQGFDQVETSAAKMGRSIATKLSPAILGITVGIKAIQGLGSAIGSAFMANEKFAKGMADLKSSLGASFTAATKPVSDFFANLIEKAVKSIKLSKDLKESLKNLAEENYGAAKDDLAEQLNRAEKTIKDISEAIEKEKETASRANSNRRSTSSGGGGSGGKTIREIALENEKKLQEDLIVAQEKYNELLKTTGNASVDSLKKLKDVETEYSNVLKAIEYQKKEGAMTQKEHDEAAVSALNNYINKTSELLALGQENEITNSKYNQDLKTRISERAALQEKLKDSEITNQEKITEARNKAIEKYEQAVQKAHDAQKAGLIDELEMQQQIDAALATKYSDLESIVLQYKLTTGETVKLRDETAALVKKTQDLKWLEETQAGFASEITNHKIAQLKAQAGVAKSESERNTLLEKAVKLEIEVLEKQRAIEREALQNSASFKSQSNEVKEKILRDFDEITAGRKEAIESANKDGGFFESIFGTKSFDHTMQIGSAALAAFDTISSAALEISRKHAEEQIAIIEEALKATLDNIEKARKEALIANGFAVASNEESLEAQLEAAKRTGDEILIYQTQRRLEEQRINDEFDEKAKQAAEAAAREKAEIEYELAVANYAIQMVQAVNGGILAVVQALASAPPPWNFILAGLSGAATAVQIGLLAANPPKPPQFADGGIVPGNSYSGDRVTALVNSGELILNRSQQDNIAEQLTSNTGHVTATIIVMMDTREIAKSTVDLVNNGFYTIKTRAIG